MFIYLINLLSSYFLRLYAEAQLMLKMSFFKLHVWFLPVNAVNSGRAGIWPGPTSSLQRCGPFVSRWNHHEITWMEDVVQAELLCLKCRAAAACATSARFSSSSDTWAALTPSLLLMNVKLCFTSEPNSLPKEGDQTTTSFDSWKTKTVALLVQWTEPSTHTNRSQRWYSWNI